MASMENPRCGEHTDRMSLEQGDIAVVGAGVIGLMTSLSLLDAGRSVTLIDPNPPGQGASFGNAGVIANYGVKPLAEPSLLLTGPGLLFKKDGPLAIQPGAGRAVIPWLTRLMHGSERVVSMCSMMRELGDKRSVMRESDSAGVWLANYYQKRN